MHEHESQLPPIEVGPSGASVSVSFEAAPGAGFLGRVIAFERGSGTILAAGSGMLVSVSAAALKGGVLSVGDAVAFDVATMTKSRAEASRAWRLP